jgi:hypothetical protein
MNRRTIGVLSTLGIAGALLLASATPAQAAPFPDWDFSETRATGHYHLSPDGLRIWTEGSTSTDKVAAYLPVSVPLASVDGGGVQYVAESGITPGAQAVVDIDGDSVPDGILVGESVYGSNWWLTNSATAAFKAGAPHTGGGNGSNWFGTLTEWGDAFPDATVVAVGFSLGSGVHGDGIVESVTLGSTVYTIDLPGKACNGKGNAPWKAHCSN